MGRAGAGIVALAGLVGLVPGCAAPARREAPAPLETKAAPAEAARWEPIGRSVGGRAIEATTIGDAGPRVLVVGGIHGDEPEGGRTVEALATHLRASGASIRVRIVRDANPDGTAAGLRTNARGIDLNRNWPARNFSPGGAGGSQPLSEPEARALFEEVRRERPDVVLVLHSSHNGPFVNFDGPAPGLAVAFASGAAAHDPRWRVVPQMGYPTPGSMGSYIGVDGGVPILTIEFARGHGPDAAWPAMRGGFDALLAELGAAPAN